MEGIGASDAVQRELLIDVDLTNIIPVKFASIWPRGTYETPSDGKSSHRSGELKMN
jgi:hypothetical protein